MKRLMSLIATLVVVPNAVAGTFLLSSTAPLDSVTHAKGYPPVSNPIGANYVVTVCLDPATTPVQAEQSVRNAVAELNRLEPTQPNVVNAGNSNPDFESVVLHELGHCMGLDHNALGPSELISGDFSNPQLYFANARRGANNVFDTNAAIDAVRGTRDDIRADDVSLNWFRPGINDPFAALPAVIDQTTYTMNVASLPVSHLFPEIASSFNPCVPSAAASTSTLRGVPGTSNVMFPVLCNSNQVRWLARDDAAMLRIARSGYDGTQGTADDYTWTIQYVGRTTACDIPIIFENSTGFAQCDTSLQIAPNLDRIINAPHPITRIRARSDIAWIFNQTDTTAAPPGSCIFRSGFEDTLQLCD